MSETEQPTKQNLWREWSLTSKVAAVMILSYLAILIWDHWGWWTNDEEYHFGFLVPLFVGFVLMERWGIIQALLRATSIPKASFKDWNAVRMPRYLDTFPALVTTTNIIFWIVTFLAMLVFLLGGVVRLAEGGRSVPSTVFFAFSFAWILLGMTYIFSDKTTDGEPIPFSHRLSLVKLLVFPAFIWLIASPMPGFMKQELRGFLLEVVVQVVYFSFEIFGYPLIKEGRTFVLPEGSVGIADACSGIRSLTGCVVTGTFLAAVSLRRTLPKLFLVLCSALLAVVFNFARSLFLTVWAYRNGGDSINGFIHDATGYAVLGFTALALWGLVTVMNLGDRDWSELFEEPSFPEADEPESKTSENKSE